MIANKQRGEAIIEINGRDYILRLTLGGLAQIENAFAISDFAKLGERFASFNANDLILLLAILLEGGKNEISIDDLKSASISLPKATNAIAQCFKLNFE